MAAAPAPAVPAAAAAVTPAFPVVAEATYNTSVTNAKERGYILEFVPGTNGSTHHVYVYLDETKAKGTPAAPPTAATINDSAHNLNLANMWGKNRSHLHLFFGGASGWECTGGVMTVNVATQGTQDGTGIWHKKLQKYAGGRLQGLNTQELRALVTSNALWTMVEWHLEHDSTTLRGAWTPLVTPDNSAWTPRGQEYLTQWTGLMQELTVVCAAWWGPNFVFPVPPRRQ